MSDNLKPCPFCNSEDVRVRWWDIDKPNLQYSIRCYYCGVETDKVLSVEIAVRMWNRRVKND